jgi:uncharacterized DUF497 family protein
MKVEWHEKKRQENIDKHGYDFVRVIELFSGNHTRSRAHDGRGGEERWMATGLIQGRYATAIYTMRGETLRMISLRSARHEERRDHQDLFG